MIEFTIIFNLSYVCDEMNIFRRASFVKFSWHCCTEFTQSRKYFRKTLRNHGNLQSLTEVDGANIIFCSNSWEWVFPMFIMSKNTSPLMNKLFLQLLVNRILTRRYLQLNQEPGMKVLHWFLSKVSTRYVHLKVLESFQSS